MKEGKCGIEEVWKGGSVEERKRERGEVWKRGSVEEGKFGREEETDLNEAKGEIILEVVLLQFGAVVEEKRLPNFARQFLLVR